MSVPGGPPIKRLQPFFLLSAACFLATIALTGCSGFNAIPDVSTAGSAPQSHPASFQGKVMGGHAAIVGAEIFVFQAGQTGYHSAPTNEMNSGQMGTDPTYGNYVLTGVGGAFNVTGDYTCNAGHPVYVASVGGAPTTAATLLNITGSTVTTNGSGSNIKFTAANTLSTGSTVSFASGAFPSTGTYAFLNGTAQTVTAATSTSFTIATTTAPTGSVTGYALANGVNNPAIVNVAVLGDCPGSTGEFNNTLSFVYIDEVSTAATAYALSAFGTGWNAIGAPASNLAGIERAATNAGQLYNINNNSSSGGIALATTSYVGGGNGIVPQATLNTLGNILASCVDSTNTATTKSDQCNTLFSTATSNGDTTGTKPTDISEAAFNIAAYPAGTGTQHGTFTDTLFALQGTSATPFEPNLSSAPNDFGIAIVYDGTNNTHVGGAESVAVDGNGQIWTTAQGDHSITLWNPVGTVKNSHQSTGYLYGYVSVDPSNDAWTGSANQTTGIEKFNNTGALVATYGAGNYQDAYTVITNQSTNNNSIDAYFFAGANAQNGYWYTPNGGGGFFGGVAGPYGVANNFISHGSIDSTGNLWLTSEQGTQITRVTPVTNGGFFGGNGFNVDNGFPISTPTVPGAANQPQPEFPAIDSANNAWIPIQTTYSSNASGAVTPGLYKVAPTGTFKSYYSGTGTSTGNKVYTGADFYQSFGAAVDGNGNIWISNRYNYGLGGSPTAQGASTIIELNSAGTAISPAENYNYGGILADALNLAIDPSGVIWLTNYSGGQLVEILGGAAPVSTPLSNSANKGTLGQLP